MGFRAVSYTAAPDQSASRLRDAWGCSFATYHLSRKSLGVITPEFLGETFIQWAKANAMAIQYIQPGKPNQNAYIERFNRTFREEILDQHLFARLDDVREAAYWWMLEYNEERPHDSLGDLTPAEYRQRFAGNSTFEVPA